MRKMTYKIRLSNNKNTDIKTKEVDGYVFNYRGRVYGVDHRFTNKWVITELWSGLQVGGLLNRKGEAEEYVKEIITDSVQQRLLELPKTMCVNHIEIYE